MECKSFYDVDNILNMLNHIVSLKKNEPDKYILLCGNHTCSYIWHNFNAATRTDNKNWNKYHNFFLENLNLFNLVWIENDVIFSHAGISQGWTNEVWKKLEFPENELASIKEVAEVFKNTSLKNFNETYINLISRIPAGRGGYYNYGSCEWEDITNHIKEIKIFDNKIIPVEYDCYQVFGHTQLRKDPIITNQWACLDCRKGFIIDTNIHEITECSLQQG